MTVLTSYRYFPLFACRRFASDGCLETAASLSYASLLALVPLAAIVFAVLAYFPAFSGIREILESFLFQNLLPETGDKVENYFRSFVENAQRMTYFGIGGLVAIAVLLLNQVFQALNTIFRVEKARPVVVRFSVFIAVLVMGPVFLGLSFWLAAYILTLTRGAGIDEQVFTGLARLARATPALIVIAGFAVVYWLAPNRKVNWRDAVAGGVAAGLLFSALRWGFGLYLIYFPTYRTIYGALAVIPLFLLWMYLSWAVVLLGAVVTAALPDYRRSRDNKKT